MTARKHDTSLGRGVYFAPGDYVGITRRMIILVIDLIVLMLANSLLIFAYLLIDNDEFGLTFVVAGVSFTWAYLTVIKASALRTVGFRLARARIVNLRGEQPSTLQMTFRMLLWFFGPFNLIYDLFWAGSDDDRQTLRDRFAGTCVVNHLAEPVGTGEIHLAIYSALGFNLMYPRVARHPPADPSGEHLH